MVKTNRWMNIHLVAHNILLQRGHMFFLFCLRDRENYVVLSSEKIYAFSAVESLSSGLQVAKSVALSFFEDKA